MRGLNLSSFKKIKEDATSAHMIHKDGHIIIISKGSLPHTQRKQLEALPIQKMAEGGKVQHYNEGTGNVKAQGDQNPVEQNTVDQPDQAQSQPQAQATQSQGPVDVEPMADQGRSPAALSPFEEEKNAIQEKYKAESDQAGAESKILGGANQKMAELPTQNDLVQANQDQSNALFKKYADKELDPSAYWKDHSKIAAGIGVLLSSVGQAVGGKNGNQAMDVINNGINREIDMQKNSQDHAMNLWKMNRQALGDNISANLATQSQLLTGVKYQILKAGADAAGPKALAASHMAAAQLDQRILQLHTMMGLHASVNNQAGPGTEEAQQRALSTASVYSPEMAKEAQKKTIPGVGVARIEPTPEDRGTLATLDELDNNLDKASAFAKAQGTTMYGTIHNKESNDIADNIRLGLGSLYGFKRINPELMKTYSEMVNSPGAVKTGVALQGYKSLKDAVNEIRNGTMNKLGIQPFKKDPAAMQWAAANPGPKAAAIIYANRHKR